MEGLGVFGCFRMVFAGFGCFGGLVFCWFWGFSLFGGFGVLGWFWVLSEILQNSTKNEAELMT